MSSKRLSLTAAVEEYLRLVCAHPEKEPKRVRDQRDNTMLILGFNKAQETLRQVLEQTGHRALAETRSEGQRQPEMIGDQRLWVVG